MSAVAHEAGRDALARLCRERLARAWPRVGLFFAVSHALFQASGALVLRAADGPRFFAEGIVAKSLAVHLLLVTIPLALRVAGGPAAMRVEPALLSMARQRGLGGHLGASLLRASSSIALARTLAAPTALAAVAAALSMPDSHALARRALVLGGVLGAGALATVALVSAAFVLGKVAPRAPRAALGLALVASGVLASFDATRAASPVGAYLSLVDVIVAHAPE